MTIMHEELSEYFGHRETEIEANLVIPPNTDSTDERAVLDTAGVSYTDDTVEGYIAPTLIANDGAEYVGVAGMQRFLSRTGRK